MFIHGTMGKIQSMLHSVNFNSNAFSEFAVKKLKQVSAIILDFNLKRKIFGYTRTSTLNILLSVQMYSHCTIHTEVPAYRLKSPSSFLMTQQPSLPSVSMLENYPSKIDLGIVKIIFQAEGP